MKRFIVMERKYANENGTRVNVVFKEEHGDIRVTKVFNKQEAVTFVPGDVVCFTDDKRNPSVVKTHKSPYKEYAISGTILNKRARSYALIDTEMRYVVEIQDNDSGCTQMFELSGMSYKRLKPYNKVSGMTIPVEKPRRIEREEMFGIKVYPYLRITQINTK